MCQCSWYRRIFGCNNPGCKPPLLLGTSLKARDRERERDHKAEREHKKLAANIQLINKGGQIGVGGALAGDGFAQSTIGLQPKTMITTTTTKQENEPLGSTGHLSFSVSVSSAPAPSASADTKHSSSSFVPTTTYIHPSRKELMDQSLSADVQKNEQEPEKTLLSKWLDASARAKRWLLRPPAHKSSRNIDHILLAHVKAAVRAFEILAKHKQAQRVDQEQYCRFLSLQFNLEHFRFEQRLWEKMYKQMPFVIRAMDHEDDQIGFCQALLTGFHFALCGTKSKNTKAIGKLPSYITNAHVMEITHQMLQYRPHHVQARLLRSLALAENKEHLIARAEFCHAWNLSYDVKEKNAICKRHLATVSGPLIVIPREWLPLEVYMWLRSLGKKFEYLATQALKHQVTGQQLERIHNCRLESTRWKHLCQCLGPLTLTQASHIMMEYMRRIKRPLYSSPVYVEACSDLDMTLLY